ncbi:transmembrane protein [Planoprotostelium fungivorum]|uniref:Transmembrane protein n=1 Tax=Planoprotostelium fungivorum TaxID=1890364 RepID=A0A2P6NN40_9EUKA|nr:transmembrane protein [Planoprotostelium fungivorum]
MNIVKKASSGLKTNILPCDSLKKISDRKPFLSLQRRLHLIKILFNFLCQNTTMGDIVKDIGSRIDQIENLKQDVLDGSVRFEQSMRKDYKDLDTLLSKCKSKDKDIKQIKLILAKDNTPEIKELRVRLSQQEKELRNLHMSLKPRTGSLFTRLFLGRVNVKHYRHGERMRLKEEYHKFKRKTDFLSLGFALLQLYLFPGNRLLQLAFQSWLLYYYATLALRENILIVNGSHIRSWWIIHHYISMAVSVALLSWPPTSESYLIAEQYWLKLNLYQSTVQILQTWYQSRKLYKMIALGDAGCMEVNTPHLPQRRSGITQEITLLLPFLLAVQIFMFYNGVVLLRWGGYQLFQLEWQVPFLAFSYVILALGNMSNTLDIYFDKLRGRG